MEAEDASALSKLNSWRIPKLIKIKSARSRLYRRRFLQVNTRWKALAEIYTMHSFAPLSKLKIFVKNCWNVCCFFPKNSQFFASSRKNPEVHKFENRSSQVQAENPEVHKFELSGIWSWTSKFRTSYLQPRNRFHILAQSGYDGQRNGNSRTRQWAARESEEVLIAQQHYVAG